MKTLKDYFDSDMLIWLRDNGLEYKLADIKLDKGELNILYNDRFCLKLYDRMGHGFGVTINTADKYDESIYDNDNFNLTWAFKYLKIKETATFNSRQASQYKQNLQSLIFDIKNIIPRLLALTSIDWNNMVEWIGKEAKKHFG